MKLKCLLALSALLIIAVGCGGGGGGGSSTNGGGGGSSNVRLFATDDMSTGFDHVWVKVDQVVLVGASGDKTLFDEAGGRLIDLKTLRDDAGRRFSLLSNRSVSSGRFSGIKVVVDSNLSVFPAGAATATAATFAGATGATTTLTLDFPSPRELKGNSNLIVDFDLSRWTLTGNVVSATGGQFLNLVDDNKVDDPHRHELEDYKGTISALTGAAPGQTFTLTRGSAHIKVQADANTSVYNEDGSPSPVLANGERVQVTGVFSTTANVLLASTIKIDNQQTQDQPEVKGQITEKSAANGTVTINVMRADGFVPETASLTLRLTEGTKLFSDSGVTLTYDQFFAQAAVNGFLEAEGTRDGETFVATRIKLEDEVGHHEDHHGEHHRDAELVGTASSIQAEAGSFELSVTKWEGAMLSNGAHVTAATTNTTEFKVNGTEATKAQFFAALATGSTVTVEGKYDPATHTIAASEIRLGTGGM